MDRFLLFLKDIAKFKKKGKKYKVCKKTYFLKGDWESVEQDLYGYNSGGYDRVNPGWSGGHQEMKWGPAEVNPIWSSPDITYQRVGREVLYNPWFPKQVKNLKKF